jgi:hypothetical protein
VIAALSGTCPDGAQSWRIGYRFRRLIVACIALVCCVCLSQAQTQDGASALTPERGVKAAYLYKFAGYVVWPEGTFARADTPITIAIMGDDQLADALAQYVAARSVDERPLVVRKQKDDDVPEGVHILFIAGADTARLRSIAKSSRPILIVTESEGALAQGSTINFLISGGRVRFEVALDSAEKRRLKLTSGVLRVAQNVRSGAP